MRTRARVRHFRARVTVRVRVRVGVRVRVRRLWGGLLLRAQRANVGLARVQVYRQGVLLQWGRVGVGALRRELGHPLLRRLAGVGVRVRVRVGG